AGTADVERDRRERLRARLHRYGDELGRRARCRVPGLDLEQLGLLERPLVDHGLHRYPDRVRPGLQEPPGDGQQLAPGVAAVALPRAGPPTRLGSQMAGPRRRRAAYQNT